MQDRGLRNCARGALVIAAGLLAGCAIWRSTGPDLGQGWSQADRDLWYEQTQGSRLLPYAWAQHLEVANGTEIFFGGPNMERYGYLAPEATSNNKPFPVGFARDKQKSDVGLLNSSLRWKIDQKDKESWLGLNCAACHTTELQVGSTKVRIDGGPTIADFQSMIEGFDAALHATYDDAAKFARFADKVLPKRKKAEDSKEDRRMLRTALKQLIDWQDAVALANRGGQPDWPGPRYGQGRLDAFGHIFNKVALFVRAQNQTLNPSTAPTSYPFIWNTAQSDRIQWNGIASSQVIKIGKKGLFRSDHEFDYGALGRNSGEVTGVFGDLNLTQKAGLKGGYRSSIQVERLSELERLLARLRPPAWPASLAQPDKEGAAWKLGRDIFMAKCASCHVPLDRADLKSKFHAKMSLFRQNVDEATLRRLNLDKNTPPGTDIWMACNAYTYQINTGVLNGKRPVFGGDPLGPVEPTAKVLETVVKGELAGQPKELIKAGVKAIFNTRPAPRPVRPDVFVDPEIERERRRQICMTEASDFLGYKARPLTGIWATAPYLHNGSVPTLYHLLLPPDDRPKLFYVGTRRFNSKYVGLEWTEAPDNRVKFKTHEGQEPIPGNSNEGHDYNNAAMKDPERWALIEYLKTL